MVMCQQLYKYKYLVNHAIASIINLIICTQQTFDISHLHDSFVLHLIIGSSSWTPSWLSWSNVLYMDGKLNVKSHSLKFYLFGIACLSNKLFCSFILSSNTEKRMNICHLSIMSSLSIHCGIRWDALHSENSWWDESVYI